MTCETVRTADLGQKYVLGQLSDAEQDAFELHYLECERCFEEVRTYQALQTVLVPKVIGTRKHSPIWRWTAVAAAVILGIAGWSLVKAPRALAPPVAGVPHRIQPRDELALLAQVSPPRYVEPVLRGIESQATPNFKAGMRSYVRGDYAAAAEQLSKTAQARPKSAGPEFYLGICYLLENDANQAVRALSRTIDLGDTPYLEPAHFYLAKAFLKGKDVASAERHLQAAIGLHGDREPDAKALLDKLEAASNVRE